MIASYDHLRHRPRNSPAKNRMREIRTSGSVGGEGGNILTYPAINARALTDESRISLRSMRATCCRIRPGNDEFINGHGTSTGIVLTSAFIAFQLTMTWASMV